MGLLIVLGSIWEMNNSSQIQIPISIVPFSADIKNSTITYSSQVQRVVDPFTVRVDLSSYNPDANVVDLTIFYSNATVTNYTMAETSDIWSRTIYFDYQAPLGDQNFQLSAYNGGLLLNQSVLQPFKILNAVPRMGFDLSNTVIQRNQSIFFNITPTDPENPLHEITWSWQILFGVVEIKSSAGSKQITNLSHFFPASTTNSRLGQYTIKGLISDKNGATTTSYTYFTLQNNVPVISATNITFPGELTSTQLFRQIESFNLKVNVSDVEVEADDINLRVYLHSPYGDRLDVTSRMQRSSPWEFVGNISVSKSNPIGEYTCEILAYETINTIEYNTSKTFDFTVVNNLPNPNNISYTINDNIPTGVGLRIKEFEDITFKINVTDVDIEGIEVIRIHLLPQDDGEEIIFYFDNPPNNFLEYSIRAYDLPNGQWITWIYVVDTDGTETHAAVSYSFDILPDQFSKVLPWIMLVIGAIVAFGLSMAVLGTKYVSIKRNFDNLLSRSGEYKKPETVSKKIKEIETKDTVSEPITPAAPQKSESLTKKHELFRKIKKK